MLTNKHYLNSTTLKYEKNYIQKPKTKLMFLPYQSEEENLVLTSEKGTEQIP